MSQTRAPRSPSSSPRPRAWWRRRTLGAAGAALALAGLVSGCSSGGGSLEKSSLTVGVVDGIGAAAFELGVGQHDFADAGLTVTVMHYNTDTDAENALQKGAIDIALGDYSSFLDSANNMVTKVRVVGEGYDAGENTIGLVTATGSPLLSQSLIGSKGVAAGIANGSTTVEVPSGDSPEYVALANWQINEQNPLSPEQANVKQAAGGSDGATTAQTMINAVLSGQAGAAVLQEPYLTAALESGKVTELANVDSGNADNMPVSGYFALDTTVKNDPNTIAAFQNALAQAQSIGESRVAVEQALIQAKVTPTVAATTALGNFPTTIVEANITNVLSLMGSANLQTGGVSAGTLTGSGT